MVDNSTWHVLVVNREFSMRDLEVGAVFETLAASQVEDATLVVGHIDLGGPSDSFHLRKFAHLRPLHGLGEGDGV
jgi:hypothetical protein